MASRGAAKQVPTFSTLHFLDSIIEAKSIATHLSGVVACTTSYPFCSAWEYLVVDHSNMKECKNFEVMSKVESIIRKKLLS